MNQDHKTLVDAFLRWYKTDPHHENRDFYPTLITSEYLVGLTKDEFVKFFFQFVKEGGKVQSGGHRGARNFLVAIEQDFANFRRFALEPYSQTFDLDNWLNNVGQFKNFGQGASTIYLNRINKNRFVIVNNKSINAMRSLGYEIKGDFAQIYHSIEKAQNDLISKYSELEDFYMADALTHFLIGTDDGKKIFEKLEKMKTLENNRTGEKKEKKIEIDHPKNLILYGPPGTGKTYRTIGHAMQIAEPDVYERFKNETDRDKLVEEFNRLRKNKQIEFVTFHQSFGYEEFVEGIKPIPIGETGNEDGEEMIYKVSDGIFKRICGEAEIGELQGSSVTSQISPESRVFKVSLKGERNKATKQQCFEKNEIRIGWEKTGSLEELFEQQDGNEYYQNLGKNDKNSLSYFYNMEEGDIALIFKDTKTIDAIGVITGDYTFDETLSEYNHVRKVKWLLKGKDISIYELNGNTNLTLPTVYQLSRITPAMVSKLVQENSGEAKIVKESKNYVLIIDEINRGNIF
ncbi:MAG TPA: hypothetical protein DCR40_07925 [Prolixibacteraceae bacterium]|nr:hypothetical protein [Prolixibacteraceae bacterium]